MSKVKLELSSYIFKLDNDKLTAALLNQLKRLLRISNLNKHFFSHVVTLELILYKDFYFCCAI